MAFTVSLNGSNYISDKRKKAFEQALVDDKSMDPGGNGTKPVVSEPQVRMHESHSAPVMQPTPTQPQTNYDYTRMFESLELGLAQSYGHQSEILHVHQQYLHNQAEYAAIFSQLMQQQGTLFSNSVTSPEQAEVTLVVLKSLAKSIEQFHQHQTETLTVHNQFLNQQSQYSQEFVQLLRQQYSGVNGENDAIIHYKRAVPVSAYQRASLTEPQSKELVQPQGVPLPMSMPDMRKQAAPALPEVAPKLATAVTANQLPVTSPAVTAPPTTREGPFENGALTKILLSIVSEKTGYPAEMLELDMDMEADLGIDSIKRVEILGALQDIDPTMPEIDADILGNLRTLQQIIGYIDVREHAEKKV